MNAEETRTLVEAYMASLSQGRAAIMEHLAEDCEWFPPASAPIEAITGAEGIAKALGSTVVRDMFDLSQPLSVEVQDMIVADDRAVVRQRITATAKNGKPYQNDYCWVYECADGRITRMHEYADTVVAARVMGW